MVGGRDQRRGYLLAEALVAGALLLLLLQASWWTAARHGRMSRQLVEEGRRLDQTRLARHVLTREVRGGSETGVVDGVLSLRAFRGVGIGCGGAGSEWWVSVSGDRALAPEKDSVLFLAADGTWVPGRVARRSSADPARCPDFAGFEAERWILEQPIDSLWLARFFEPMAYRFSDEALRVRTGARWQPLTDQSFEDRESSLRAIPGPGVEVRVRVGHPLEGPRDRTWRVRSPS